LSEQQVPEAHDSPAGKQAPPLRHVPPSQRFEQHWPSVEQAPPPTTQSVSTQTDPSQPSEQQSAATAQAVPSGAHRSPETQT
jgi:hypothetical protein